MDRRVGEHTDKSFSNSSGVGTRFGLIGSGVGISDPLGHFMLLFKV
jgi:hypothetical protein